MAMVNAELRCAGCGETLAGLSLDARCGRCGLPASRSLDVAALDPVTGTVNTSVACVACGYNLRTLALDSVCPECAAPVWKSLRRDDLRFADARWLRTIRLGLSLAATACALSLILLPIPVLLVRLGGPTATTWYYWTGCTFFGPLANSIIWCVGLLLVATPEPAREEDPRGRRLKQWIRILGILAPIAWLVSKALNPLLLLLSQWHNLGPAMSPGSGVNGWLLACSLLFTPLRIVGEVGALLLGVYLRDLARRERVRTWPFTLFVAVSALGAAAHLPLDPILYRHLSAAGRLAPSGNPWDYWLLITSGSAQLAMLAFGIISLVVLLIARRMVSRAIRQQE
ncbi:MAG TPA: hypothetical protein PKY77_00980 [Phycisphaerae bacterium]|nr:hypothetical protein [Phycisphaerae bacterium]HRY67571.1 hypothetical protein [Phycisphaerae bacterium]HSA24958.1 hypothetical protein [Phycisphaerae bacterium]